MSLQSEQKLSLYVDHQLCSPYAMFGFIALQEKNLPFELKMVDLISKQNHQQDFSEKSFTLRVPTLTHNDFSLSESSAIIEYLDDTFVDTAVYPVERQQRARARQIQAWLRSDLLPIRAERNTQVLFYGQRFAPLSDEAMRAAQHLFSVVEHLLPVGESHLFGRWSIVDTELALMLNRLVMHGDQVPQRLADYARLQFERESVQRWMTHDRPALAS